MIRVLFPGTDFCEIPDGKFGEVVCLLAYRMGRSRGSICEMVGAAAGLEGGLLADGIGGLWQGGLVGLQGRVAGCWRDGLGRETHPGSEVGAADGLGSGEDVGGTGRVDELWGICEVVGLVS